MIIGTFVLYFVFISVIAVWVAFLLIKQDKEIRRLKSVVEGQTTQAQINTKQLEEFYQEKKQFMEDKNNEIKEFEAKLKDERDVAALSFKTSEMAKAQLKQQQEEFADLKAQMQKLNEELRKSNETRLIEVQNERQKCSEVVEAKENKLQKLGSMASSMESVMDTLALISKEMHRRVDEHHTKMTLLGEKTRENFDLIAQLKQ